MHWLTMPNSVRHFFFHGPEEELKVLTKGRFWYMQQNIFRSGVERYLTIDVGVLLIREQTQNELWDTWEFRLYVFKHLLYTNQSRSTSILMVLLKHTKWTSNFLWKNTEKPLWFTMLMITNQFSRKTRQQKKNSTYNSFRSSNTDQIIHKLTYITTSREVYYNPSLNLGWLEKLLHKEGNQTIWTSKYKETIERELQHLVVEIPATVSWKQFVSTSHFQLPVRENKGKLIVCTKLLKSLSSQKLLKSLSSQVKKFIKSKLRNLRSW